MTTTAGDLATAVLRGEAAAVARAISLVERHRPGKGELLGALAGHGGDAHTVGITGPPGAGKSTLTAVLVDDFRRRGDRVAVLAVDPSSPRTGGALLGDRLRMRAHALDDGVFIRSMASRGELGGTAAAAPDALRVLAAAGYGIVLVETVGVGQSEVDIADLVDTVVVVAAPGAGDEVQAAKAGLGEVGDIVVVNKADQPAADATVRVLRRMVGLDARGTAPGQWRRPVVRTVAATGEVAELVDALDRHRRWLDRDGQRALRRRARTAGEVRRAARALFTARLVDAGLAELTFDLVGRVDRGELTAEAAGARLLTAAAEVRP